MILEIDFLNSDFLNCFQSFFKLDPLFSLTHSLTIAILVHHSKIVTEKYLKSKAQCIYNNLCTVLLFLKLTEFLNFKIWGNNFVVTDFTEN